MKLFADKRLTNIALLTGLVGTSLAAWFICYSSQLVLVYNDAMSHMNIARLVIDNQQPGLAQIGSVWLPLGHILKLPLIWNEWAWHSGFAGSIISMLAYVFMVLGIYWTIQELTRNRLASVVGAVVAALNLNMLYLQSTPLTEPLYLVLFVYSIFFLIRYIRTADIRYMLPLAFVASLQIVSRYDGWFVAAVIAAIIMGYEFWIRGRSFMQSLGQTLFFATPVAFACLLWLGWNAMIFGDPLFFATGPYSARAQQSVIEHSTGLITKGDIGVSLQAFGYGVAENVGWIIINAALLGWILYLNPWQKKDSSLRLIAFAALSSVIVFNVLALYLGFSIMNLPQLNWNPGGDPAGNLFNVRYGILALPFAAVGAGLLVAKRKLAAPFVLLALLAQGVTMYHEQPISLRDGRFGSSAFRQQALADELQARIGPDDQVLLPMYDFNPVAFASGIPLNQFIHEGIKSKWNKTLKAPQTSADWIVTTSATDEGNPLNQKLRGLADFEDNYQLVYEDDRARLFKLKAQPVATARN